MTVKLVFIANVRNANTHVSLSVGVKVIFKSTSRSHFIDLKQCFGCFCFLGTCHVSTPSALRLTLCDV